MAEIHPGAPHHLPPFITAPGETDYFYNGSAIFIIIMIIVLGTLYFRLHALPEHLAHDNSNKVQFQLVGVLALLGLFTHNNVFWVAALLLAIVRLPDIATPLIAMAESLASLAGRKWRPVDPETGAIPAEGDVTVVDIPATPAVAAQPQPAGNGSASSSEGTAQPETKTAVGNVAVFGAEGQAPAQGGSDGRSRVHERKGLK